MQPSVDGGHAAGLAARMITGVGGGPEIARGLEDAKDDDVVTLKPFRPFALIIGAKYKIHRAVQLQLGERAGTGWRSSGHAQGRAGHFFDAADLQFTFGRVGIDFDGL